MAGMVRANIALVRSVTDPATFLTQAIPAMQTMAAVPPSLPVTLENIYARMLLQALAGNVPNTGFYATELDRLTQ